MSVFVSLAFSRLYNVHCLIDAVANSPINFVPLFVRPLIRLTFAMVTMIKEYLDIDVNTF